ncbi:MAG TPA: M55 family metallopeptidase [Streptosporangiaceae bacterium]|nr:M55 family metallopeptidase [Streptosporangiaceae bacterium]
MHVLISADMEGVTGVTCPQDVEPGTARWEYFRAMLTGDVNAAVTGFLAAGADKVTVNEAHADKRNLLLGDLDERAVAIVGTHKAFGMMQGIDAGVDAVAFVGYHAGAGHQGVLAHTYLGTTLVDVLINGSPASEGRMNALLAAEFGVPVVLITGDDLTCEDAAGWAPGAERVAVKRCVDRYTAACLSPVRTAVLIRDAASASLARLAASAGQARPEGPFCYEVEFDAANPVVACTAIPGVRQTGPRRVEFTLTTMAAAIRCFKAVTVLAAASVEQGYG